MKFKKVALIGAVFLAGIGLSACSNSNNDTQGKVEYTLKSVTTTSYRNEFADEKPKNVIKVVYHVKNDGKQDLTIGTDLNAYGPDNSKLKDYPIEDSTFDSVAPGKEADVTTGFGTKKLGSFELQFAPLVSTEKAAKFKVTVK